MEEGRRIKSESLWKKVKTSDSKKMYVQNHTECFWHPPPSILPPKNAAERPKRIHSRRVQWDLNILYIYYNNGSSNHATRNDDSRT